MRNRGNFNGKKNLVGLFEAFKVAPNIDKVEEWQIART